MKKTFIHLSEKCNNIYTSLSLSLSLSLSIAIMLMPLLVEAQRLKDPKCDSGIPEFPVLAPPPLCLQFADFIPDVTIGCPGCTTFVSTSNIPSHPSFLNGWINKKITITGVLVLDESLGFEGCTVKMAQGSEVLTQGASTFFSTNSKFFACNGMWKGIKIHHPSGQAAVKDSWFEDAEIAFRIDDGRPCSFRNNFFNRNNIGISSGDAVAGQTGLIFTSFVTNKFDCDSPLNTNIGFGTVGFAGIKLEGTTATINSGFNVTNTFKRLQYGIHSTKSDVIVVHNKFEDMKEEGASPNGGIGIYTEDGALEVRAVLVQSNGAVSGAPKFHNCIDAGIEARSTISSIKNTRHTGKFEFGIVSHTNSVETAKIQNNDITMTENMSSETLFGIAVERPNLSGYSPNNLVNNNKLTMGGSSNAMFGILASLGNSAIDIFEIKANLLTINGNDDFIKGISVVGNGSNYRIFSNEIDFNSATAQPDRFGIQMLDAKGLYGQVSFNLVNQNTGINDSHRFSIFLSGSENWTLCSNEVTGAKRGIHFKGDNDPCFVKQNSIETHETGLLIENDVASLGAIGIQTRHGNTWNVDNYAGFAAQNTANPAVSPFLIEDNAPDKFPSDISPASGWFFLEPGSFTNCTGLAPEGIELTGLDNMVISDNPNGPYAWEWRTRLLLKLIQYPSLRPSGSPADTFFQANISSVHGKLAQVDNMVQEALRPSATLQADLESNLAELSQLFDDVVDLELSWTDTTTDFSLPMIESKQLLFNSIKAVSDEIDNIKVEYIDAIQASLDAAASLNATIVTSPNTYEDYQRQLNDLVIQVARGNELNSTEESIAMNIASVTLNTGDRTEKVANDLLARCDATYTKFRSMDDSQSLDNSNKTNKAGPFFSLLPNPANKWVDVQFEKSFAGDIEILGAAGHVLLSQRVDESTSSLRLDTSELSNGIYFVRLNGIDAKKATHQRLVITR